MSVPFNPTGYGKASIVVESAVIGFLCAVGFSAIAFLVGLVAVVALLLGGDADLLDVVLIIPLIIPAYIVAGIFGGIGFGLMKQLRGSAIGWMLTGMFIAGVAYGAVGLTLVVAYVYLDINIIDYRTVDHAWESLPTVTGGLSLFGGFAGLYYWWTEGRAQLGKKTSV